MERVAYLDIFILNSRTDVHHWLQGTPYSTINKKTVDAHKTITFLHYRQESNLSIEDVQVGHSAAII
jgi:hypothetical protein